MKGPVLISGGAGFIGTNLATHLLERGESVLVFDNLSRSGVERNLDWLRRKYGDRVEVELADVRDAKRVEQAVQRASRVFHFAAQVAVTTSITSPKHDLEVNLGGTLNVLEALRGLDEPPPLLFTSTNKVYGALEDIPLQKQGSRYLPVAERFVQGIAEDRCLDFHSPYGCSKGAADQYVLDYARTYGLRALVFRMSCVYGPHQFGTEDQGWVAHFLIQALKRQSITVYGDGCQVRDVLFVHDLVEAMDVAMEKVRQLSGRAFNIGGGAANSTSLLELLERIGELPGLACEYAFDDWRLGDQRYFVANHSRFTEATGWRPRTSLDAGLRQLLDWTTHHVIARAPEPRAPSVEERSFDHVSSR